MLRHRFQFVGLLGSDPHLNAHEAGSWLVFSLRTVAGSFAYSESEARTDSLNADECRCPLFTRGTERLLAVASLLASDPSSRSPLRTV